MYYFYTDAARPHDVADYSIHLQRGFVVCAPTQHGMLKNDAGRHGVVAFGIDRRMRCDKCDRLTSLTVNFREMAITLTCS